MAFDDELRLFKERIRKRAAEKLEILTQKIEEEERQKRLGPGGLDPVEVYESLPEVFLKIVISEGHIFSRTLTLLKIKLSNEKCFRH